MAKKPQPITQALNVELSKIGSCLTIAKTILNEPSSEKQKADLRHLLEQAEAAQDKAFEHLRAIMATLSNL